MNARKLIIMVLGILFVILSSPKTEASVYFADANLKAAVEAQLGISDPTPTDMLALAMLSARVRGITDLTGLEYATNLTYLSVGYGQISDISALAGLTKLEHLWLYWDQIWDISALAGLTNLRTLVLTHNRISDISAIAGLMNLTYMLMASRYELVSLWLAVIAHVKIQELDLFQAGAG